MRIGICGCQNNGKSSLVEAFLQKWTKYEYVKMTHRTKVKELNLPINQLGDLESQRIIRDAICDDVINNSSKSNTIFDRTILDNIVYTLWLADKGRITDTKFIADSINICRETVKMYDIIFWLPLNEDIALVSKEQRDIDPNYRIEIDNIFTGVYENYKENTGILFDKEDQPAFIPLFGNLQEKLDDISQYLNEDGDLIETNQSVFSDLEGLYNQAKLLKEVQTGIPQLF